MLRSRAQVPQLRGCKQVMSTEVVGFACVVRCRTTRVGTERHLLCIEDPFELSHDLGRTVHAGAWQTSSKLHGV